MTAVPGSGRSAPVCNVTIKWSKTEPRYLSRNIQIYYSVDMYWQEPEVIIRSSLKRLSCCVKCYLTGWGSYNPTELSLCFTNVHSPLNQSTLSLGLDKTAWVCVRGSQTIFPKGTLLHAPSDLQINLWYINKKIILTLKPKKYLVSFYLHSDIIF